MLQFLQTAIQCGTADTQGFSRCADIAVVLIQRFADGLLFALFQYAATALPVRFAVELLQKVVGQMLFGNQCISSSSKNASAARNTVSI